MRAVSQSDMVNRTPASASGERRWICAGPNTCTGMVSPSVTRGPCNVMELRPDGNLFRRTRLGLLIRVQQRPFVI